MQMPTPTSDIDPQRAHLAPGAFLVLAGRSLRTKLVLAFLAVTILSVGTVAFVTNRVVQTAMTNDVGERLHTLAKGRALEVGDLLSQEVDRLQTLALSTTLHDEVVAANAQYRGDSATIQAQILTLDQQWVAARSDADPLLRARLDNIVATGLRAFLDTFPDNAEVFVTDRYGATVAAANRTSDYYQADEMWWQSAYNNGQGAVSISQPAFDDSSKTLAVDVAVPVYSPGTHAVVGILRTTYRMHALANLLVMGRFGTTGDNDLLLSDGQSFRSEGDLVPTDPSTVAQLRTVAANNAIELNVGDEQRLLSMAPVTSSNPAAAAAIENLHWSVIVDQSRVEALQSLNNAVWVTLVTGLGVLLFAGLLAFVMAQAISVPIGQLNRTAQQIAAGDLSRRVHLAQHDEIGALAQSFNTMAESLAARITTEQAARAEAQRLQQLAAEHRQIVERTLAELHQSIAIREQLSATVQDLSNPVLPVLDGILVMPLIGVIDTARATVMVNSLLQAIEQHRAHVVILDVTGVPMIDTQVARALLRAADAGKLLGAQTILVGIRPELAQTIVGLGLSMANLVTKADLQNGMAYAAQQLQSGHR
jgi:anti-anti-sigma regulatory factor/HAMP domain-containing protein